MSRLAINIVDLFKFIANDKVLMRLLYYTTDPLNPSKSDVQDLPDFYEIRKDRIIRAPKTNDIQSDANKYICRICMYFGTRRSLTKILSDQEVYFDVFTHIDTFEIDESRSSKIIDRLAELLNDSNVTGIGVVKSGRMIPIGAPNGYIGYRCIFEFGSGNK